MQVLRFRASDSEPVPIHLNTIKLEKSQLRDKDTAEETGISEAWMKHVPNIPGYKDAVFDWDFRTLVAVDFGDSVPEEFRGWWLMYICNNSTEGVSSIKNRYFAKDKKVRARGDVFVFRLVGEELDQFGRARYAEKWLVPNDKKVARHIFVTMALASRGEGSISVVDSHAETSVAKLGDQQ